MNYKHFIIGGVLGLGGLIAILWLANLSGGPGSDADFVYKGPAAEFRASQLVMAFTQGGPEAAAQLKNQGVEIMGTVLALDKPAIVMEEGALVCYFPEKAWPKIEKKVGPDDIVTIRGLCVGLDTRRRSPTVVIKGCELIDHEKNPHGGMPHP